MSGMFLTDKVPQGNHQVWPLRAELKVCTLLLEKYLETFSSLLPNPFEEG